MHTLNEEKSAHTWYNLEWAKINIYFAKDTFDPNEDVSQDNSRQIKS